MEYRYNKLPELGNGHSRKHIVVLTGAGISVESGLTTFRKSDDSLWGKYDFQKLASVGCFQEDPEAVHPNASTSSSSTHSSLRLNAVR